MKKKLKQFIGQFAVEFNHNIKVWLLIPTVAIEFETSYIILYVYWLCVGVEFEYTKKVYKPTF